MSPYYIFLVSMKNQKNVSVQTMFFGVWPIVWYSKMWAIHILRIVIIYIPYNYYIKYSMVDQLFFDFIHNEMKCWKNGWGNGTFQHENKDAVFLLIFMSNMLFYALDFFLVFKNYEIQIHRSYWHFSVLYPFTVSFYWI